MSFVMSLIRPSAQVNTVEGERLTGSDGKTGPEISSKGRSVFIQTTAPPMGFSGLCQSRALTIQESLYGTTLGSYIPTSETGPILVHS